MSDIKTCTPKSIWNMAQNRPTLIVRDLAWRVCREGEIYQVLLNRGVFKWFSVRRKLIKYKYKLLDMLKACEQEREEIKLAAQSYDDELTPEEHMRLMYLKGYKAAIVRVRGDLRELFHDERWQAPDNDEKARRWLRAQEEDLKAKIIKETEDKLTAAG